MKKLYYYTFILFIISEYILGNIWFYPDFIFSAIPLRSVVLIILTIFTLYSIAEGENVRKTLKNKAFLKICMIFFILLMLSVFASISSYDGSFSKYLVRYSKYLIQPFLVFYVSYIFVAMFGVKKLVIPIICFLAISSFVAIMQLFQVDLFWNIRLFFDTNPDIVIRTLTEKRVRPGGMAPYYISLAYLVASYFALNLYMIKQDAVNRKIWLAALLLMFFGLFASQTRSAILGMLAGMAYLIIKDTAIRKWILRLIIVGTAVYLVTSVMVYVKISDYKRKNIPIENYRKLDSLSRIYRIEESAKHKPKLFFKYIKLMKEYPFGAGIGNISYKRLSSESDESPHNQFINAYFSYGIIGLLLIMYFYYYMFKICIQNNALVLASGLISYIVMSFFHNAGPFFGDPFWWHFGAIIVSLPGKKNGVL